MKLCAFHAVENDCVKINQVVIRKAQNGGKIIFASHAQLVEALLLNIRERPNPLFALHKKKKNTGKKVLGAVLAFPLPFGVIGLHRIYLGTRTIHSVNLYW